MKALWLLAGWVLLRHLVTSVQGSNNSTSHCNVDARCHCLSNSSAFWDTRCQLNGSTTPLSPLVLFKSLDLSKNGLQTIPTEFLLNQSHLVNLTLAHNRISTITDGAFGTLSNVKLLDLSFNPLQKWEGDVKTQLPNLRKLIVTGTAWIPDSNILTLPSLGRIIGVTWSNQCANCTLFRLNISKPFRLNLEHGKNNPVIEFVEHGFVPYCPSNRKCSPALIFRTTSHKDEEKNKAVDVPKKLFYSSYAMGAIAILLNLIVLSNVISSRSLRQTPSMLLIANMAICDLFIGIYSITIGSLNIFNFLSNAPNYLETGEKLVLGDRILCPLASTIFTSSQCVAAVTSLLLTVEKYCSIVHCMNPYRRLSKKVSAVCLLCCWILSILYALSPLLLQFLDLSYSPTMMCSFPVAQNGKNTFLICLGVLMALYIANIPLYARIFLAVRRSGAHLGVKREAAILKKIALVVGSNFLLLLTPMILIITFVPVDSIHETIELNSDRKTRILFVVGFWFPIACLGLNACINPILCAFRQEKFVKRIRKVFKLHKIPPFVSALRKHEGTGSISQMSTASSQIVLYKVTHFEK